MLAHLAIEMKRARATDARIEETFADENGPMACEKAHAKGSFHWSFADNKMSFVKVDDACKERADDLTSGAWLKK